MTLAKYIFNKWQEDAEPRDKIRVKLFTIFDTFIASLLATKGLSIFLGVKNNNINILILLVFAFLFYHVFKLWHISFSLFGIDPEECKKEIEKQQKH